jgi:hypothetical protein
MLLIDPNFGALHLFLAYWWNHRATYRSAFSEIKCGWRLRAYPLSSVEVFLSVRASLRNA